MRDGEGIVAGRMIDFDNGRGSAPGYLATPDHGFGLATPGVIVLHAWWGLTAPFRQACDRLAAAGFVALAPDLYRGKTTTTVEEAERLAGELDPERASADVRAAAEHLRQRNAVASPDGRRALGVVGFSLGGAYALEASVS